MLPTVRRVLPHEYPKYRAHLKSLDSDSLVLRFGHHVQHEVIDKLCDTFESDNNHHILFCVENNQLEFVAVGHIALDQSMELAFSVLKSHQGQGLGSALMRRCIQWCRTHNVLSGNMICVTHNQAIRHLCTKHGIKMTSTHGETLAEIHLDPAGPDTYFEEAIDRNAAVFDWLTKRALLHFSSSASS